MDQRVEWYPTTLQDSPTDISLFMNLWKTVQGVQNLNIDCNFCMKQSFINPSAYPERLSNERLKMHGGPKRDFIPLRNNGNSYRKKTTFNVNNVRSTTPPHGGKKRRENNSYCDEHRAPWIRRNYSAGMVGLHEEIEDFYQFIRPTEEEHCMREHVIQSVKDTVLQLWPTAKVDVFGSFRTSLFLPTSDIDIVLFGKWDNLPLWTLKEELVKKGIADESTVKVLDRAAVPIIKFQHLETGVKVDICFNMKAGVNSIQLIKDFIKKYPDLPKLVFVLKQFLVVRDLNEVWTGGLSSYALLLLCVSFLQLHPLRDARSSLPVNLGVLLMEFFELYGKKFNYDAVCIRVKNGGCYMLKEEFRQQLDNGSAPSLLSIEDPLTSGNDLGRGSYGMLHVKHAFDAAYRTLCNAMCQIDYNSDNHFPISHLSLILRVPDEVVEYREKACHRWRIISASPALSKSNHCHRSCTSSGYCSASSTDSDADEQRLPFNGNPLFVQRLLHRANSADCLNRTNEYSRKFKDVRNGNPTRTQSADRLKPNPAKAQLARSRDIFTKDSNFHSKSGKTLAPIQRSIDEIAPRQLRESKSVETENSLCFFADQNCAIKPPFASENIKESPEINQVRTKYPSRHTSSNNKERLSAPRHHNNASIHKSVLMEKPTASDALPLR